jgi:hypothetical protein
VASPFVHLVVADLVWPHLGLGDTSRPLFFFGSVAPDADKLGLCTREASHFWSVHEDVSGALRLLRAHPHLAAPRLSTSERAFVAGYLCHLVTDEQWMFAVYRPFFGRHSPYGGSQEGAELQWALHAVVEQRLIEAATAPCRREVGHGMVPDLERGPARCAEVVAGTHRDVGTLVADLADARQHRLRDDLMSFLPMAAFAAWRDSVVEQASLASGAERARQMHAGRAAVRASRGDDAADLADAIANLQRLEALLARLPPLLERAASYVPADVLATFERRSVDASVTLLHDYLAGRPLQPPMGTVAPSDSGSAQAE